MFGSRVLGDHCVCSKGPRIGWSWAIAFVVTAALAVGLVAFLF